MVPAFVTMLQEDRRRRGFTVGQAVYRIGVSSREYLALEAGSAWPSFGTWDMICKFYWWAAELRRVIDICPLLSAHSHLGRGATATGQPTTGLHYGGHEVTARYGFPTLRA